MFDPSQWAVWDYRATITNDGATSGNHTYSISPGKGNMAVLLGGEVLNGEASSARNIAILLANADSAVIRRVLVSTSVAAGTVRQFPTSEATADDGSSSTPPDVVIAGTELLDITISSIGVNENTALAIQFLISGSKPVVTLTSPANATEAVTEDTVQ